MENENNGSVKRKMMKLYEIIKKLLKQINEDYISEYSAKCAYYTILSFIPFIIVLITLVQYTNIEKQVLFDAIYRIVPRSIQEIVISIIQEVYSKSIGTISISIIFTLWSAGRGLYALSKGFQSIYRGEVEKEEGYFKLRIKSVIETIIFIVLIILALILLVFGNTLISIIKKYFNLSLNYKTIYILLTKLGFIIVTFIIFLILYKFMPKHKVTFKSQIIGALIAAIFLNFISFIFSIYLDVFKGFSITYGSLTTLILVMMWIYWCFYILFLGVEINKYIKKM